MAGHSKFANIKHRKAAQDSKRAKVFTKFIRELTVAAREGFSVTFEIEPTSTRCYRFSSPHSPSLSIGKSST